MKVFIQWATDPAQGWVEIDSSEWTTLSKKPDPVGGEIIDSTQGWINAVNCQGIIFNYDHYAMVDDPSTGGVFVAGWNDDSDDWTPDLYNAFVWLIEPIQFDSRVNAMNTKQSRIVYAGSTVKQHMENSGPLENTVINDWNSFVPPGQVKRMQQLNASQLEDIYNNTDEIKHGIEMTPALFQQHEALQVEHPWMEWIE